MAHLYKSRLQNYAQKRNISFPTYACEMKGPPHARLFKTKVTIDGLTFEGPEFCTTIKDAENAAAKLAFMSISTEQTQEDDCLYKSLLQELAQKKGLLLPLYATNTTGQPHMPCFASTVEIAGECFAGKEARTKKQAEMNAAKVAYTALTEGVVSTDSKMQTTISNQTGYSLVKEAEKAKGLYWMTTSPGEDTVKHKMTLPPLVIHQSQPKATPNVVDAVKLNIKREKLITQPGQAREGSGSNGKRSQRNQSSLVNDVISNLVNLVMDSGAARLPLTKTVIRPHVPGMAYEGSIQVSDDEWVAMKVNVAEEM